MTQSIKTHFSTVSAFAAVLLFLVPVSVAQKSVAQKKESAPGSSPQDVLTYHGNNLRTGWFSSETILTTSNVNAKSFGLLATVPVDGRVDAEPLVAMQMKIANGVHNVVFVATENDSVYAIDADDGTLYWHHSYGIAVPYRHKFDSNVFPQMGIQGTPVIDRNAGVIYFVADIFDAATATDTFYLHSVLLSTGQNLHPPAAINFSTPLPSGGKWVFDPKFHLQRPGLLEANGDIYIAFGSNSDGKPGVSRGTMLRYDPVTLTQLSGQVTNDRKQYVNPFYLSSIWQSGYAPAADENGDVYFSTGNSDPKNPSYNPTRNRPDSMVHLSADLSTLVDSFTTYNYFDLDQVDLDIGSGGLMLLPDQAGSIPHMVVAGGKDGRAFLLNRDSMGGYTKGGPDKVLQTVTMGACWCGPAFFVGSDNMPYVITGGRNGITSWQLQTTPTIQLVQQSTTGPKPLLGLPQRGGSIPVVSSNGTTAGSAIVWFVQKPATSSDDDPGTPLTLMAYSASDLTQQLFSAEAGTWLHAVNSNANTIPTVANGKVYIASNKQLEIFGLLGGKARKATDPPSQPSASALTAPAR